MSWELILIGALVSGLIAINIGVHVATRIGALLLMISITISFLVFRTIWDFRLVSGEETLDEDKNNIS
jgi:hypothetical protein